ncbi:unnamed protein product [Parascedosporium putredinis]|uniref:Uncharacterized protein n=1 Tax=Parascedosporium putredinis TaxID=1442378 RepID=A0A9P1M942_9PEZI|nr:unnamed protein product [Parascedosporium putredinis]CAI7993942.1 unnamed protein product [Parascedosporium putredinis]
MQAGSFRKTILVDDNSRSLRGFERRNVEAGDANAHADGRVAHQVLESRAKPYHPNPYASKERSRAVLTLRDQIRYLFNAIDRASPANFVDPCLNFAFLHHQP